MLRQTLSLSRIKGGKYMASRQGQQGNPTKHKSRNQSVLSMAFGGEFKKYYRDVGKTAARSPLFIPRAKLPAPRFAWDTQLTDQNKQAVLDTLAEEAEYLNLQKLPKLADENDLDLDSWMAPKDWKEDSLRIGLIGKKIAVTNYFEKETGWRRTCTMIQIPDNHVVRYFNKSEFNGRNAAAIVGAGSGMGLMKNELYNQYCRDAGVPIKAKCFRFSCSEDAALMPGTRLHIGHFRVGDFIDCKAKSVGYGHLDPMQRWHAGGGPALDRGGFKRGIGSISSEGLDSVTKGRKMDGKVGGFYELALGRKILRINYRYNVMWISGRIPGHA